MNTIKGQYKSYTFSYPLPVGASYWKGKGRIYTSETRPVVHILIKKKKWWQL